jgi:DNA-binding transcriptional regulator YiaG
MLRAVFGVSPSRLTRPAKPLCWWLETNRVRAPGRVAEKVSREGKGETSIEAWRETEEMMGRTLDEMLQSLTPGQRAAVERRAEELIAEELSLRDLRKALNLTQAAMAKRLKKGQDMVSRIEQRDDLLLSTLQGYVKSLGGELELVCRFKDRAAVRVKAGGAVGRSKRPATRRAVA